MVSLNIKTDYVIDVKPPFDVLKCNIYNTKYLLNHQFQLTYVLRVNILNIWNSWGFF